jgi:hypothetical protein
VLEGTMSHRGQVLTRSPAHLLTRRTRLQSSSHCGLVAIGPGGLARACPWQAGGMTPLDTGTRAA